MRVGSTSEGSTTGSSQDLPYWVTEMALPKGSKEATLSMMNSSITYLDGLDYVQRYAWFGAFRANDANAWTGSAVALFDDKGGLTEVGALYLGGEQRGYRVGMTGAAGRVPALKCLWIVLAAMMASFWV